MLGYSSVDLITRPDGGLFLNNVDAIWSDDDLSFLDKAKLFEIKEKRTFKGQFFGGLAFKYQKQPLDFELACENSKIITDISTTSGTGTGQAPTKTKIEELKKYLGSHPLAIASGVSEYNIESYKGLADYILVASSITHHHSELIDIHKLTKLIQLSKD